MVIQKFGDRKIEVHRLLLFYILWYWIGSTIIHLFLQIIISDLQTENLS